MLLGMLYVFSFVGRILGWCSSVQWYGNTKKGKLTISDILLVVLWAWSTFNFQMEGGRISLEGTVCEDYYKIRQLLYAQFAII